MNKFKHVIVHVLDMNPNKRGLVELQLLEMAEQLTEIGWIQICIYNADPPDWLRTWSDRTGGTIMTIPNPAYVGASKSVRLANELKADIVHCHFMPVQAPIFSLLKHFGFHRIVKTQHTYSYKKRFEWSRRLYRHWHSRYVSRFIAVSKYIQKATQRDYLLNYKRISTILNGVNLEFFKPREDKYKLRKKQFNLGSETLIISAASHLHPHKRLDMLVRAMPIIVDKVPNAQLIIAGGGQERENLLSLIDHLSLKNHARVLSADNRVELIYAASDIGVLPSEGEGLPGGAIEALACGLPLVATPCGGLAEVPEDGVSGVLVYNQTPEGLSEAIIPLLLDKKYRETMGYAARKRAEMFFDVRRTARETIKVYKELLEY